MAHKRKYSLYYQVNRRYLRVATSAYIKEVAVHVFQDKLLNGLQYRACLRPVKEGEVVYYVVHRAYGFEYNTAEEALAAWEKGTDFSIYGGPYCSSRNDIHVLIRLKTGDLVVAHGTPKETPCGTATTSTS